MEGAARFRLRVPEGNGLQQDEAHQDKAPEDEVHSASAHERSLQNRLRGRAAGIRSIPPVARAQNEQEFPEGSALDHRSRSE